MEIKTIRWKIVAPVLLLLLLTISVSIWAQQGNTNENASSNQQVNTQAPVRPGGGGTVEDLPLKEDVQYIIRDGNGRIKESKTTGN